MSIQLKNITTKRDKQIHNGISVEFVNEINVITGESGSGKTTLLRIILGLDKPDSGDVYFNDLTLNETNISKIRKDISWIPQKISGLDGITLIDLLIDLEVNPEEYFSEAKEFNLDFEGEKKLDELSVGEMQRAMIIVSILQKRNIFLADEPSSALDSENKLKLIDHLKKHKGIVICVSHDQDIINSASKIWELKNGELNASNN